MKRTLLLALLLLGTASTVAAATDLQVATDRVTGPPVKARVALVWPEITDASGAPVARFQIYRRLDAGNPYPDQPIHPQPLAPIADCSKLLDVLEDGAEWSLLVDALAEAPATPGADVVRFDPCKLAELRRGSGQFARLQLLARSSWKIAHAIGQGYLDEAVVDGQRYHYELRGLTGDGKEIVIATDVSVVAGAPIPLRPPTWLRAEAGDYKVLLYWPELPAASAFIAERAASPAGPWLRISESFVPSRIHQGLDNQKLARELGPVFGFIDFMSWSESGAPISHGTLANPIFGPKNGQTYSYRVAGVDLLGNIGAFSTAVTASPADATAPRAPVEVYVTAFDDDGAFEIRWTAVTRDVLGRMEADSDAVEYRVFRFRQNEDPDPVRGAGVEVLGWWSNPKNMVLRTPDTSTELRPPYGETTFYYRVQCRDAAGNESAFSAAVPGTLRDITPPAPPVRIGAESSEEEIQISWPLNREPDMSAYQVYRSLCDAGTWRCGVSPDFDRQAGGECENGWVLVGTIDHRNAAEMKVPTLADRSIETGSPLCYAYLVKAQDQAQNLSGSWPIDPPSFPGEQYVCQRLRDTKAPEGAIITALRARDDSIAIDWIGEPVQDIAAYYVYRADSENGQYGFVGGMTVPDPETPQANPARILTAKLSDFSRYGCDTIPLVTHEQAGSGSLTDAGTTGAPLDPKKVYWYKVTGVDQNGLETELAKAVAVSTFTFSTESADQPVIVDASPVGNPRGIRIRWSPGFDSTQHLGFAVYRADTSDGDFVQVKNLVTESNEYLDRHIAAGATYWYTVVRVDLDGKTSAPSSVMSATAP